MRETNEEIRTLRIRESQKACDSTDYSRCKSAFQRLSRWGARRSNLLLTSREIEIVEIDSAFNRSDIVREYSKNTIVVKTGITVRVI